MKFYCDKRRYKTLAAARRDARCARVAGLAARGGLAAAPPPQLTRNGATAPLLARTGSLRDPALLAQTFLLLSYDWPTEREYWHLKCIW